MPLQKNQIVQTALDILDRDGLEGVTLRRLATELNVKAASIYWHIANKETLLDEMANAILEAEFGTLDFSDDRREWAVWLDTMAHDLRKSMLSRREGARVVAGAHLSTAVILAKLLGLTTRVLHQAGFSHGKAATITMTMTTFTFGFVIEEQASPPLVKVPEKYLDMYVPIEPHRTLREAMTAWGEEGTNGDIRFATGVRIIINGIHAERKLDGIE